MLTRSISEWETAECIIGKYNGDTIEGSWEISPSVEARWIVDLAADYNVLLLGNDKFYTTCDFNPSYTLVLKIESGMLRHVDRNPNIAGLYISFIWLVDTKVGRIERLNATVNDNSIKI
ncbi:hypothetical protein BD779DRAFT_1471646 [Infundibulicybe gibba]|nr:hypothetical protein BD779DRAFT_1471646 [Infundibulicybe gibba]